MTVLIVLEAVLLALLALLVVGLLRSHADILRRLHEMGAGLRPSPERSVSLGRSVVGPARTSGRAAHDLVGETPTGDAVGVAVLGADQDALIAFLTSGCLTCAGFWRAFASVAELGLPTGMRPVIVTKGPDEESVSAVAGLAPAEVLVVMSSDAWQSYEVPGSPYFVLVGGAGGTVLGEGTAVSWDEVRGLMTQATKDAAVHDDRRGRRQDRREWVDAELMAAGIGPGHSSLFSGSTVTDGGWDSE